MIFVQVYLHYYPHLHIYRFGNWNIAFLLRKYVFFVFIDYFCFCCCLSVRPSDCLLIASHVTITRLTLDALIEFNQCSIRELHRQSACESATFTRSFRFVSTSNGSNSSIILKNEIFKASGFQIGMCLCVYVCEIIANNWKECVHAWLGNYINYLRF